MSVRIVVATRNVGKVREFARLLADFPLVWLSLAEAGIEDDLPETGDTFAANAAQKATLAAQLFGGWALADDSGLCVSALDGRPGVYSARYGGPHATQPEKWAKLLGELAALGPDVDRHAWFECVLALAHPDHDLVTVSGRVDGQIAFAPRGDGGFGYDPLFLVQDLGLTMAEIPADQKDSLSHRGRAIQALRPHLLALTA